MPIPLLNTIEDAVLEALRVQTTLEGETESYLKTLKLYDGELDLDDLRRAAKIFPAMLVAYSGCEVEEQISAREWRVRYVWTVVVADKSMRRSLEARRGTFGTSRMIEDARRALVGRDLDLEDMDLFGWPDEVVVEQGRELSVYALSFPVSADLSIEKEYLDEWLELIGVGLYLQEHGPEDEPDIAGLAELEDEED